MFNLGLLKCPRRRTEWRSFLRSLITMPYKILPTSLIRMLRLLFQPNRHIKNEKLIPGWLGTFYYFSENVIGYTSAGVDRKILYISNLKTKYVIWFSEKSRLPKIALANHITKRLNSLCQSNPNFWKIVNQYWQPSTDRSFPLLSNGIALQSDYDKSNQGRTQGGGGKTSPLELDILPIFSYKRIEMNVKDATVTEQNATL